MSVLNNLARKRYNRKVAKVYSLKKEYPDAYEAWFGADDVISSLSNDQLNKRLSKSPQEWKDKQLLIEKQRERDLAIVKANRLSQARVICSKYPNIIKKRYKITFPHSDYDADIILSASIHELQREEDEIIQKSAAITKRYDEIKRKYPKGLALVKKLRSQKTTVDDVYTPTELKAFKRGSAIYNSPRKLILLSDIVFDKYNSISLESSFMEEWSRKQKDFFSKTSSSCGSCFLQKRSGVALPGIGETGKDRWYIFPICHLYKTEYCKSDSIDYSDYPIWKENAIRNQSFLDQERNYKQFVYDDIVAYLEKFDRKPLILIADSGLGKEWDSIEDYHFSYLKKQLKSRRIKILPLKDIDNISGYNEKTIVIIELLTNKTRFHKICSEVLQKTRMRQARLVYLSLRRELSQYEANSIIRQNESKKKEIERNRSTKYLFFDTETTGLPCNFKAPCSDTSNWPRLVQLSWILTDGEGKVLSNKDFFIRPSGFIIPKESTEKHRITTEIAMREGVKLSSVLDIFLDDYERCDVLVGHNIEFDKKIIGAELIRLGKKDVMEGKRSICTMKSSIGYCKISSKFGTGLKYPTLQELYNKLFGHSFDDAHNAAADIAATKDCFWEMRRLGLL